MRFLFLMDPMQNVLTEKDTTFAWMIAASARGHECLHAVPLDLEVQDSELFVKTTKVSILKQDHSAKNATYRWELGTSQHEKVSSFDAVFVRKDPPFDIHYLHMTQLLERVRGQTLILNDPQGLRAANEKLYTMHFNDWMPKTLVTSSHARIREFVHEVGGHAVIKPLDGMGGAGIFLLNVEDRNFGAILEATLGEYGSCYAMVQEYLPAAREGDKRILLLEGKPLGAILRVPRDDEARANIHVGGSVVKARITAQEHKMIQAIAPQLKKDGLIFVGLDVIGERLTEVNVTSPTGIQQMQRLDEIDYSAQVIEWVEHHIK